MADEDKAAPPTSNEQDASGSNVQDAPLPPAAQSPTTVLEDRTELVNRARTFLSSPQVVHEDPLAKRRFLAQKGLNDSEIERLMQELPPLVPPRTYPQPPPSNIPNLLTGALRIISWIAGGSMALVLVYFRFIYPRLSQSFQARTALRSHHKELLARLATSAQSLKETQEETFSMLPKPQPFKEHLQYSICHTTDDISVLADGSHDIPVQSLLRCAIEELVSKKEKATSEAIFQLLEAKFPWVQSEEEPINETHLWEVLSTYPVFEHEDLDDAVVWHYRAPISPPPPPLVTSLSSLQSVLPEKKVDSQSVLQKTLSTLSDFTGYIASQTYAIPYRYGTVGTLSPEEDEIRREIRSLKGLVLNRRSFLPPRPTPPPAAISQVTP